MGNLCMYLRSVMSLNLCQRHRETGSWLQGARQLLAWNTLPLDYHEHQLLSIVSGAILLWKMSVDRICILYSSTFANLCCLLSHSAMLYFHDFRFSVVNLSLGFF